MIVSFIQVAVEAVQRLASSDHSIISLSPSSIAVDMVEKHEEYLQLPTLQAYLICAQDEPRACVFLRENGTFPPSPVMIEGREASVDIPALSLSLPMAGIFAGIPDAPTPA